MQTSANPLDQDVLCLNGGHQAIGVVKAQKAIENLTAKGGKSWTALLFEDGYFVPFRWQDWICLEPRDGMSVIHTTTRTIMVPRIIIAVNFHRLIVNKPKLNKRSVAERDGHRDQYTGKKLKPSRGSIEHVVPRSKGGRTEWTNVVYVDRDVNSRRGNQDLETAGLKLLSVPKEPRARKPAERIAPVFEEWKSFLRN